MTYLESSFVNFNTTDLKFVFNEFSSDLLKTEEVDHVGLLWTDFFTLPGSFWPPEGMTLGRLLCMRERERGCGEVAWAMVSTSCSFAFCSLTLR